MKQILVLRIQRLIILVFLSQLYCQDKYIISPNSQYGQFQMITNQFVRKTINFKGFNSAPQVLLGISGFESKQFKDKENEYSLSVEDINSTSANISFSTTSLSQGNVYWVYVSYFAFISDEIFIHKIKIDQYDIGNMSPTGGPLGIRQLKKQYNLSLSKKPNTKRNISCFIIGFRQEFSDIPEVSGHEKISFYVESISDINDGYFELTFTTLNQQNTLKWVNINCIEFYQYEQNFEPKEFIQSIVENKYSYHHLYSTDQQMVAFCTFEISSQIKDITFDVSQLFYGVSGIDSQVYSQIFFKQNTPFIRSDQVFQISIGYTYTRSIATNFVFLKMKACPKNCEVCLNIQVCQKCNLNFILDNNGQCKCKKICNYCDSNLNCIACEDNYFLYKGQCYINKPKATYCKSRTIDLY